MTKIEKKKKLFLMMFLKLLQLIKLIEILSRPPQKPRSHAITFTQQNKAVANKN